MVEFQLIAGEEFAGAERIGRTSETAQLAWQFGAGGFQVALEANIHLLLACEALRVDYARANRFRFCFAARSELDMASSGSVAALAVDAFGERAPKARQRSVTIRSGRVGVVTEQAAMVNFPSEVVMARLVVAGTHSPALFLRIPGDGKLGERARRGQMQVAARMLARANNIRHFLLKRVFFTDLRAELIAALEEFPVAAEHAVIAIGGGVKELVLTGVVLDDVGFGGAVQRSGHGH